MAASQPTISSHYVPSEVWRGSEPLQLLEAIMRFTAERNREALETVLLQTIIEMQPVARAQLYRRDPTDGSVQCVIELRPVGNGAVAGAHDKVHETIQREAHDCMQGLSRSSA